MNTAPPSTSRFFPLLLRGAWLVLVAALTLEVAARLEDWIRYDAPPLQNYTFDQMFHWTANGIRGVPHGRYMRWVLNSYGLHGPEFTATAATVPIVVFGASEPFGVYEDAGKEFPRVLERELNSPGAPARFAVINAAMPGMTPGFGLSQLRDLQPHVHARFLLIYPTPTQYIGATKPYCTKVFNYTPDDSFEWPQSRFLGKLTEKLKPVLPAQVMTFARARLIQRELGNREPLKTVSDESLQAMADDLKCEVSTARALGMTPIILTHPNRFGTVAHPDDAERLVTMRLQHPRLLESGFLDLDVRANRVIRQTARAEGVELVDADRVLSGRSELFADHAHMTNEGSALMAKLLVPAVLSAYANAAHSGAPHPALAGNPGTSPR